MSPIAYAVNKRSLFHVLLQISLHPNPVKTKQFLSSVPFISYRRILSFFRPLRPADTYQLIYGIHDALSGRYH